MQIIPAIDIKDGHCVRLRQGDMQAATVFSEDPAAIARHWLELGAQRLHLVDLNGAVSGRPRNELEPMARDGRRILGEHRRRLHVALTQAHAMSVLDIDRGNDLHWKQRLLG